eukprot:CAMPEP_0168435508 /NCGR_PEP_ID=MMETSP0228-20121227/40450_1 /TAXON_ID=133427 /ORGANISM="Protoceratium reticulatum, Strain CCCM 535 (=CCMP 1889)" /LENGTH=155 /DNA_ID=CAMNT_0008449683 /DNA_START=96 /DNA_END=560 /DNA_ORIENTATION=+
MPLNNMSASASSSSDAVTLQESRVEDDLVQDHGGDVLQHHIESFTGPGDANAACTGADRAARSSGCHLVCRGHDEGRRGRLHVRSKAALASRKRDPSCGPRGIIPAGARVPMHVAHNAAELLELLGAFELEPNLVPVHPPSLVMEQLQSPGRGII